MSLGLEKLECRCALSASPAATASSSGLTVLSVLRYGVHHQPTVLVLQFSKPLNAARAQDVGNYFILSHASRPNPVALAVYNPVSQSVVLFPRRTIDIHHPAQLLVIGTSPNGLADTSGNLLNGANTVQPGSDFSTFINRGILAGPLTGLLNPSPVAPESSRALTSAAGASLVDGALQRWQSPARHGH
jgi:hypothetical protein